VVAGTEVHAVSSRMPLLSPRHSDTPPPQGSLAAAGRHTACPARPTGPERRSRAQHEEGKSQPSTAVLTHHCTPSCLSPPPACSRRRTGSTALLTLACCRCPTAVCRPSSCDTHSVHVSAESLDQLALSRAGTKAQGGQRVTSEPGCTAPSPSLPCIGTCCWYPFLRQRASGTMPILRRPLACFTTAAGNQAVLKGLPCQRRITAPGQNGEGKKGTHSWLRSMRHCLDAFTTSEVRDASSSF
jgi:hypothetical protein